MGRVNRPGVTQAFRPRLTGARVSLRDGGELSRLPEDLRLSKIFFDAGKKTAGVQAVDKGVIEFARDRNNTVFQVRAGTDAPT